MAMQFIEFRQSKLIQFKLCSTEVLISYFRTHQIDMEIKIPDVTNTTSVAFGGPLLNELFVTSGSWGIDPESEDFAESGGLYRIKFYDHAIIGVPMNKVHL